MAALLDEIAGRLHSIEEAMKEGKPEGAIYPINVIITGPEVLDFIEKPPYTPLFTITLYNDGPDEVYPSVNIHQKITPLKPGENIKFEYIVPKIIKLYLDVEGGGRKAIIRGFGAY
jgi:hypothetical protein